MSEALKFKVSELGKIMEGDEFQFLASLGQARPIMELKAKSGDMHVVFVVDGLGLGIGSMQTKRVLIIPPKMLVELAKAAGVEESRRIIELPNGSEGRRG